MKWLIYKTNKLIANDILIYNKLNNDDGVFLINFSIGKYTTIQKNKLLKALACTGDKDFKMYILINYMSNYTQSDFCILSANWLCKTLGLSKKSLSKINLYSNTLETNKLIETKISKPLNLRNDSLTFTRKEKSYKIL